MARIIEAEARISAVDATGSTFEAIAAKVRGVTGAFRSLGGAVGSVSAGMNRSIGRLQSTINTLAPVAASAVAYEGMRGVSDLVHSTVVATSQRVHERVMNALAGMTPEEQAEADKLAVELSQRYRAFSAADAMHTLRNLRSIVGTYKEAVEIIDPIMKLKMVTLAQHPERAEELGEEFDKLEKSEEIIGATQDPKRFASDMNLVGKAMSVFGSTLRPTDFYDFAKYARQAGQSYGQDFLLGVGPTLIQTMGGKSAGQAMSSFYQQFIGGRMNKAAANMMEKFGLLDPKKVEFTKAGLISHLEPGALLESDLAKANPYQWIQQVLLPALRAHGVTTKEQFEDVGAVLASKQTTGQALGIFATQQSRIGKDLALEGGAMSNDDAMAEIRKHDLGMAWQGVTEQWRNLMSIAGDPLSGVAADGLNELAAAIVALEHAASDMPALGAAGFVGGTLAAGIGSLVASLYALRGLGIIKSGKAPVADLSGDAAIKAMQGTEAAAGPSFWNTALGTLGIPAAVAAGGYTLSKAANDLIWADPKAWAPLADKDDPMLGAMSGDFAMAAAIANANPPQAEVKGDANLHVDVNVQPSAWFETFIDTRIDNKINAFKNSGFAPATGTSGSLGESMPYSNAAP